MSKATYTAPRAAEDVTNEMVDIVREIISGWHSEGRIDWEDVWDRADGAYLDDGTKLDLPQDLLSPVYATLRKRATQ